MDKKYDNPLNKIIVNKKINKSFIFTIIAIISIVLLSFTSVIKNNSSNALSTTTPIDGIICESLEGSAFHIHARLDIFINGQNYTLPALIGINDDCLYWMHTHDETGIIHIESPIQKNFTLGQFFDIWKQTLNNNQILNYTSDTNHPISVYVNGTKVSNGTNFRDINIHSHDVIALIYGKDPNVIPTKADFSAVDPY